jgi:hypothetical protein
MASICYIVHIYMHILSKDNLRVLGHGSERRDNDDCAALSAQKRHRNTHIFGIDKIYIQSHYDLRHTHLPGFGGWAYKCDALRSQCYLPFRDEDETQITPGCERSATSRSVLMITKK